MQLKFENVDKVVLNINRWNLDIVIEKDGKKEEFIASADNGATEGSGLFFGTPEELKERLDW